MGWGASILVARGRVTAQRAIGRRWPTSAAGTPSCCPAPARRAAAEMMSCKFGSSLTLDVNHFAFQVLIKHAAASPLACRPLPRPLARAAQAEVMQIHTTRFIPLR